MSATFVPYVYGKAENKQYINAIEAVYEAIEKEIGHLPEWWICGGFFCTQLTNGYYHCFKPTNSAFDGRGLQEYRIDKHGNLIMTDTFIHLPEKQDMIKWCAERNLSVNID